MKATPSVNLSLEELAESLDQMFFEIADLKDQIESMGKMLADRDKINLLMVKHVERLTREKEVLLMHLGLKYLESNGVTDEFSKQVV